MGTDLASTLETITERQTSIGTAQIVRYRSSCCIDQQVWMTDKYRIDLCVTPRPHNARARYKDYWGPHRFEPLGAVYALPPGEQLHFKSDAGTTTSIVCELRPEALAQWLGAEFNWRGRGLEATLDLPSQRVRGLLMQLGDELQRPGLAHETMIELIVGQLALDLARCGESTSGIEQRGGLALWRLKLIDERLTDSDGTLSVSELAAECRMSVRQLMRGFRASRSRSIGSYIKQYRIEQAKRLLSEDRTIKFVADILGFGSASSFSYAFRRTTGRTPKAFREDLFRLGQGVH